MKPLKQNSFEEEWQKAFVNASVSPANDLWEKIERELEQKKRRPFLFFLRPSAIAIGLAATLVLVMGGILFLDKNNKKITTQQAEIPFKKIESKSAQPNQTITQSIDKTQDPIKKNINDKAFVLLAPPASQNFKNFNSKGKTSAIRGLRKIKNQQTNNFSEEDSQIAIAKLDVNETISTKSGVITQSIENKVLITERENVVASNSRILLPEISPLKSKEYIYLGSHYTLKRNKLLFDYEISETQTIASNEPKFWIGLQSGVAPFDPNMKLGGLNTVALREANAFAAIANTPSTPSSGASPGDKQSTGNVLVSSPQNAIKSGVGLNIGFTFGHKISKKWHLESGLRYLRGNSTLQSNTYAFQQSGFINTFFANYLLTNSDKSALAVSIPNGSVNTVVADVDQFNNRYEYLMVPIQIGYEIGISKKLKFNLLTGISTDIFLQNTIGNNDRQIQEIGVIDGKSKVYKPLNISGLGGIRASYLLSKHWQLNMGSSYQHALFSGINSSTDLQMRLRMLGVNYGLNFRF